jgi:UTP--glucose-1-phosphate uridylyltransferase
VIELDGEKISQIIEKPEVDDAPSDKVLCGRYVFTSDSKELLMTKFPVSRFGEFQTIELQKYWMTGAGLIAVDLSDYQWYDSGNPLSWLKSQIDYGLRNPDYSNQLRLWLNRRLD